MSGKDRDDRRGAPGPTPTAGRAGATEPVPPAEARGLKGWSERKRQAARAERASRNAAQLPSAEPSRPLSEPPVPAEPPPDLPPLDAISSATDITGYLARGVPEDVRQQALRLAWARDPAIRDFIESAENQYDWNATDGVPGFGPLAAGRNLARLLEQATGGRQLQTGDQDGRTKDDPSPAAIAPDAPVVVTADAPPALVAESPTTAGAAPGPGTLDAASSPLAPAAPASLATDATGRLAPSPGRSPGRSRRHGGALPQ